MNRARLILCTLFLGFTPWVASSGAPIEYRFDPVHSQFVFFVEHLGFSHAIGRFTRWDGSFRFDPQDWSSAHAEVRIQIDSLEMGDPTWNRTLLAEKWFDAEQFPQASFVADRLEAIDATHGRLHGALTLHGQTRPQVLELTINRIGTHPYTLKATAGFSATTTIQRSDFGIDALVGEVGDRVELRIEVEGQLAKALLRPGKR